MVGFDIDDRGPEIAALRYALVLIAKDVREFGGTDIATKLRETGDRLMDDSRDAGEDQYLRAISITGALQELADEMYD